MSVQQDFDRIALLTEASEDGAAHNDHYHHYLLRHLPKNCGDVLEIGCGTGSFSRRLSRHLSAGSENELGFEHADAGSAGILPAANARVLALDFSPEMIRIARERSTQFPSIEFELADVLERPLESFRGGHGPPAADTGFDCIASIATLHHLPYAEMLFKMKTALKPGGVLLILDLFEPAHITDSPFAGLWDSLLNLIAIPVSVGLRLIHRGRLLPRREERAAWAAHEAHDLYPTMREVHSLCARVLPGAKIKQHLLWRYSIVWEKPC